MKFSQTALVVQLGLAFASVGVMAQDVKVLDTVIAEVETETEQLNTTSNDAQDINRRGVRRWEDFGKKLDPSVMYNRTFGEISIRGKGGPAVEVTEDGVPVPYNVDDMIGTVMPNTGAGPSGVSFATAGSVDVSKGPGGTQNSSSAGEVAVQSLGASDLIREGKKFGVRAGMSYASVDRGFTPSASAAVQLNDKFSAVAAYSQTASKETRNFNPKPAATERFNRQGLLRFQIQPSAQSVVDLGVGRFSGKAQVQNARAIRRNQEGQPITDAYAFTTLSRNRAWVKYNWQSSQSYARFAGISAQLYYSDLHNTASSKSWMLADPSDVQSEEIVFMGQRMGGLNLNTFGYVGNANFSSKWQVGLKARQTGFTQTTLRGEQVHNLIPNATARDVNLALSNTLNWRNRVQLNLGMRYDYFYRHAQPIESEQFAKPESRFGKWSPSVELRVKPFAGFTAYARYAEGFRAPTVPELYYDHRYPVSPQRSYSMQGNPKLLPENSKGYEVGAQWQSANVAASFAFFQQWYKDYIRMGLNGMTPSGDFFATYSNVGRARSTGWEANLNWRFKDHWYVRSALVYVNQMNLVDNVRMNNVAPLRGTFGLGYDNGVVAVEWSSHMASRRPLPETPEVDRPSRFNPKPSPRVYEPGHIVSDLSVSFKPKQLKGLSIAANVNNIFNQEYWTVGLSSGVSRENNRAQLSEPRRNFRVTVSYQY